MSAGEGEARWQVRSSRTRRFGYAGAVLLLAAGYALTLWGQAHGGKLAAEQVWVHWCWEMTIDPYWTAKAAVRPNLPGPSSWETCFEHPSCRHSLGRDAGDPADDVHLSEDPRDASALAWVLTALPLWTLALSAAWVGWRAARCAPRGGPAREEVARGLVLAGVPALLFLRWGHQVGRIADEVWQVSLPPPLPLVPLRWSLGVTAGAMAGAAVILLQRRLLADDLEAERGSATPPRSGT